MDSPDSIKIGEWFCIEEMPQGCIINEMDSSGFTGREFTISSPLDALMIIKSLNKMLKSQFPDLKYNIE